MSNDIFSNITFWSGVIISLLVITDLLLTKKQKEKFNDIYEEVWCWLESQKLEKVFIFVFLYFCKGIFVNYLCTNINFCGNVYRMTGINILFITALVVFGVSADKTCPELEHDCEDTKVHT